MRNPFASAILLVVIVGVSAPAGADIKAFNEAVSKGDYKAAANEAISTWPTLDKSRPDIGVIAREFGYATYAVGDYDDAIKFAEFAAVQPVAAETDQFHQPLSNTLLRLIQIKLNPSDDARGKLFDALQHRADLPGFDNISYHASDAVIGWDMKQGDWKAAQASSRLGVQLATAGGAYYIVPRRRMEMLSIIADTATDKSPANAPARLEALRDAIVVDMDGAASDKAAEALAPVYWEVRTWAAAIGSPSKPKDAPAPESPETSERITRLLFKGNDDRHVCNRSIGMATFDKLPEYVLKPVYRGISGGAIVSVDLDKSGKVINAELLGAVPEKSFGEPVAKFVKTQTFKPGAKWDPSRCSLESKGVVIEFSFDAGRR